MKLTRRALAEVQRRDLQAFAHGAFGIINPGKEYKTGLHSAAMAYALEEVEAGRIRRLNMNIGPRMGKSELCSVIWPAWLLGRNPAARIICVSYSRELADDFATKTLSLMQSDWYRQLFPNVQFLSTKRQELRTTAHGVRFATSVGGTLTGKGGDIIIVDDPMNAADVMSDTARQTITEWFDTALSSRLDDRKKGAIVVVAQRFRTDDLSGHLMEKGGWLPLVLPTVAFETQDIPLHGGAVWRREPGDLLHEERFGWVQIEEAKRELGLAAFEAQYNQRPSPPGGHMFKLEWLERYDKVPSNAIEYVVQSWDTGFETGEHNDYSVCATWGMSGKRYYLLDVFRDKLPFFELEKQVYRLRQHWRADLVVVEAAGNGLSLFQNIRGQQGHFWICKLRPNDSKEGRAARFTPWFEEKRILVPNAAPWLEAFQQELLSFPYGKHDDQVDAVTQFLGAVATGNLGPQIQAARARKRRH